MDIHNLTVILLAGDPKCGKLIPPDNNETYLARAIRAGRDLGCPIILVYPRDIEIAPYAADMTCLPAGDHLFASLAEGLRVCKTDALVVATDLPFVSADALRDFYREARRTEAEVSIALADLDACRKIGHETKHPVPLDDRLYKFGSVFLLHRSAFERILAVVKPLLSLRKQPVKLVWQFGSWRLLFAACRFVLSYRWHRFALSLHEAGMLIEKQVGIRTRGIVTSPSLAIDHD
ncbi:nucleotidyltransferase family protein [Candidatus Berkelbacteria bacterium]|nr:nucleotidyltransferase family protein [Candidatus Berkelbacteria bacterium]